MEPLDFSHAEKEVIDYISKNNKMVLATCLENRVTARTMSIIHKGMTLFCQTDKNFIKYQQIKENPNVALSVGNMQIEGIAKITGHPFENRFFDETYKMEHESSYTKYSHLKDEVVIEIEPQLITLWKYSEANQPYRDFIHTGKRQAYREYYEITDEGGSGR
jgi:Pyridoxamine 5''-phosphate oxidase.